MKLILLLGAAVLCIPTWLQLAWIDSFYRFPTHEARVAGFLVAVDASARQRERHAHPYRLRIS